MDLKLSRHVALVGLVMLLSACASLWPTERPTEQRLAALPDAPMPLDKPVQVAWNDYQVPFIEAETDTDLAFALGVVHHHLRAGQLLVLKHISQGRLSEIGGPFANDIDRSLRILGFGRRASEIVASWPEDTRSFVDAFVAGLNWHQEHAPPPPEQGLLGVRQEPWRPEDLVTIGRLAGTDVTWIAAVGALEARLQPDWQETWQRLRVAGHGEPPMADIAVAARDDGEGAEQAAFEQILGGLSRSGSNSLAIAPSRSATGAALIANDPHLGLNLPNLWLLVGMKSPSYHVVGMMIPGLPFVALGRNPWIAWGGTNARASSSDLVDVSDLPPDAIEVSSEPIRTRLWRDVEVDVRWSPHGPIISDSPFVKARPGEDLALRWIGHEVTDEITAFLRLSRATSVEQAREAFASYGVSAQNMVVVDREGSIGKLMAAWLPRRPNGFGDDLVVQAPAEGDVWEGIDTPLDMPALIDPEEGFITSANDRPDYIDRPAGYFFSPGDRIDRMAALVTERDSIDVETLQALQVDVRSESARELAHGLAARLRDSGIDHPSVDRLAAWQGDYAAESSDPVVFETILYHTAHELYGVGEDKQIPRINGSWGNLIRLLLADIDRLPPDERRQLLQTAVDAAALDAERFDNWGEMHRVRVQHLLGNVPVLGRFFQFADLPASGSRETLMKRSHNLVRDRHNATFGAQSRHISDMSDDDANWFVLFGGQDGWLGSTNFADQVELWREGRYIQLPLRPETVAASFPYRQEWQPEGRNDP